MFIKIPVLLVVLLQVIVVGVITFPSIKDVVLSLYHRWKLPIPGLGGLLSLFLVGVAVIFVIYAIFIMLKMILNRRVFGAIVLGSQLTFLSAAVLTFLNLVEISSHNADFDIVFLILAFAILIFCCIGLLGMASLGCQALNISALTSRPLREKASEYLKSEIKIPCYVTTASLMFVWDPDDLDKLPLGDTPSGDLLVSYSPRSRYVPYHIALHDLTIKSHRVDYVIASAALPYGVVPSVEIEGQD